MNDQGGVMRETVSVDELSGSPVRASDERIRRADAVAQARASVRLEGVDLDVAALVIAESYVDGTLTGAQLVEEMIRLPL